MIAALINAIGIVIGGTLGTLFRGRISDRFTNTLMAAMGLVIVGLGVQGAVGSNNTLCVVVSLALGAMIGELLHIDRFLDGVGDRIMNLFKGKKFADGQFSEGLITASVLFVTGAMAILGSIEAGVNNNYSILITKTVIDTVVAVTMASAMGVGVVFSFVPVLKCSWSIKKLTTNNTQRQPPRVIPKHGNMVEMFTALCYYIHNATSRSSQRSR